MAVHHACDTPAMYTSSMCGRSHSLHLRTIYAAQNNTRSSLLFRRCMDSWLSSPAGDFPSTGSWFRAGAGLPRERRIASRTTYVSGDTRHGYGETGTRATVGAKCMRVSSIHIFLSIYRHGLSSGLAHVRLFISFARVYSFRSVRGTRGKALLSTARN